MRSLIISSFILAFILSIFPISSDWRGLRPEFLVLMVIYWSIYTPQNFGIFAAWSVGLLQDTIEFSLLGHNALGLSIVAYICQLSCQYVRNYTIWQQAGWVFILVSIYLLFGHWIVGMGYQRITTPFFLLSAFISAFLWPLIVVFCGRLVGQQIWYENKD